MKRLEEEFIDVIEVSLKDDRYDADLICSIVQNNISEFETAVYDRDLGNFLRDCDNNLIYSLEEEYLKENQIITSVLTFNNLKILKRILQKEGSKQDKEAILILIKQFKDSV